MVPSAIRERVVGCPDQVPRLPRSDARADGLDSPGFFPDEAPRWQNLRGRQHGQDGDEDEIGTAVLPHHGQKVRKFDEGLVCGGFWAVP